jgi:CRISPR-associated endonuclease/helicase Cas3
MSSFDEWFKRATGNDPFPYQRRFATEGEIPQLVDVPTGLGKTAMAVLGWLWRRRFADENTRKATPRRLVYCLPMRVLVEQTRNNAVLWLHKMGLLAGTAKFKDDQKDCERLTSYRQDGIDRSDSEKIPVHVLMGGEEEEDWDIYPEGEQIIIGTQDMLLSRALNRGYAATRSRWPIQFGLLNTDCLWVFDEIQLMGAGLATTTQLEAFRRLLPNKEAERAKTAHGCRSVWMSATMRRKWLKTVDFSAFVDDAPKLVFDFETEIKTPGLDEEARKALEDRWGAKKPLVKANERIGDAKALAEEVLQAHKRGTRTIVIVNTVKRACALFDELNRTANRRSNSSKPKLVLLHSRFRPDDRKKQIGDALADIRPGEPGTIVVSTQVIEAGVDITATTLFTELGPWASLVQRFGRCNRRGQDNDKATIYWIAVPAKDADAETAAPYEIEDLNAAKEQLKKLTDVGLRSLPKVPLLFEHSYVIRSKDLIDLFDTTPDLAGNDIDIDRYVRDIDFSDVQVFWRDYDDTPNETENKSAELAPRREELCPVPIGEFKKFVSDKNRKGLVWRWSFLDKTWQKASEGNISPGQVFLVNSAAGGYSRETGWTQDSKELVEPVTLPAGTKRDAPDSNEGESLSQLGIWETVAEHTDEVRQELDRMLAALSVAGDEAEALRHGVRWHDRGKAHEIFKRALPDGVSNPNKIWAKAAGKWKSYERKHFRHELASGLSVLDPRNDNIPDELRDLITYLVAAHHGKVRLAIRSLPNENHPDGSRRFARGIWDDDELPPTDLGGDVIAPAVRLSLEPMELGLCEQEPFTGRPSWAERMIGLRDDFGPFRLAYLEAILRAADMRASRDAEKRSLESQIAGKEAAR